NLHECREYIWTQNSVRRARTWETFNYLLRKRGGDEAQVRLQRRTGEGRAGDESGGRDGGMGRGINWRRDSRSRRHLRVYSPAFAAVNASPCLRREGARRRKQLISVPTLLTCFLDRGIWVILWIG
ncbi:hypothetical protein GW17_00045878, partial [Ensete ventricosum]